MWERERATFTPTRNARVFVVGNDPERPLDKEDRRAYQLELKHFLAGAYPDKHRQNADKVWEKLQSKAKSGVDDQGRPVLQLQMGESSVQVGVSAANVLNGDAPPELVSQLLEARLQSELRGKSATLISEAEVSRDWLLLQKTISERDAPIAGRSEGTLGTRGNRR